MSHKNAHDTPIVAVDPILDACIRDLLHDYATEIVVLRARVTELEAEIADARDYISADPSMTLGESLRVLEIM